MDNPQPTTEQETNYHLDRIASAVESLAETQRLGYEMSIDVAAKNNALSDSMTETFQGLITGGLSGLLGDDEPES